MFPANIVSLIFDYDDSPTECGAWRATVDFLKREAGETKFGYVPFPEALVQMYEEQMVGFERDVESNVHRGQWGKAPLGMRYRQVIRAQPDYPSDLYFLVPRGVRAAEDGTDWGVKWGRLTIAGIDGIKPINDDSEYFKYPTETCVELLTKHHEMWSQVDEGDRYDSDPDYEETKPDDVLVVPHVVCLGCEEPCQVQLICDC